MTVTCASPVHATLKEIVMALEKMHEAEGDPIVRELMEVRQKALHDEAAWRAESRREGWRETARRLLDDGIARSKVMTLTGLTEAELEEV
jgi:predicted transposase/invertase (TIGR01784 family)